MLECVRSLASWGKLDSVAFRLHAKRIGRCRPRVKATERLVKSRGLCKPFKLC